jgi:hypothetical protein
MTPEREAQMREAFETAMRDDGYSAADDGPMALEIAWRGWVLCAQHIEAQLRKARETIDAAIARSAALEDGNATE